MNYLIKFLLLISLSTNIFAWGANSKYIPRPIVTNQYNLSSQLKKEREAFFSLSDAKKYDFINNLYKAGYFNIGSVETHNIYVPYISYFYENHKSKYIDKIKKMYTKGTKVEKYNFTLAVFTAIMTEKDIYKYINDMYLSPEAYKYLEERYPRNNSYKIADKIRNKNELELVWSYYFTTHMRYFILSIKQCGKQKYHDDLNNKFVLTDMAKECHNTLISNKVFY